MLEITIKFAIEIFLVNIERGSKISWSETSKLLYSLERNAVVWLPNQPDYIEATKCDAEAYFPQYGMQKE